MIKYKLQLHTINQMNIYRDRQLNQKNHKYIIYCGIHNKYIYIEKKTYEYFLVFAFIFFCLEKSISGIYKIVLKSKKF